MTGETKVPLRKRIRLTASLSVPKQVQSWKKETTMTSYVACNLCKRARTVERTRGSYLGDGIWYEENRTSQERADNIS